MLVHVPAFANTSIFTTSILSTFLLLTGCTSSQQVSEEISGPVILGSMNLIIEMSTAQSVRNVRIQVHLDLESRKWQDIPPDRNPLPITYILNGSHLQLTLVEDPYTGPRQPMRTIVKRTVSIEGNFRLREGRYVYGPFNGSINQIIVYQVEDPGGAHLEWEHWNGIVTGTCLIDGNQADRLRVGSLENH